MPFTSEEIQEAVEKLVVSSVPQPYDTLGTRKTDAAFDALQEAAAGVFLLYPKSPYYVVSLGSQRLLDQITDLSSQVEILETTVSAVARSALPIEDVSSLFNAKSALQALSGALSSSSPKDVTKVPAYQRFDSSLSSFLAIAKTAVVSSSEEGADVVMTPDQARDALPGLLASYRDAFLSFRASVTTLARSMDVYDALNLPSLVARGVVERASAVLGAHADELTALSPADRLLKVRQVVLDALTAKSAVKTFGSFTGTTEFVNLSGTGAPYIDGSHVGIAASTTNGVMQPYAIFEGENDTLVFTVDGSAPITVKLAASVIASLNGQVAESASTGSPDGFFIGDGTNPVLPAGSPPNNNRFSVRVKDRTSDNTYTATLTTCSSSGGNVQRRTAEQVCADINPDLPGFFTAEPYFNPLYFQGSLIASNAVADTAQFDIPGGAGSFAPVTVGSLLVVTGSHNGGKWLVTAILSTTSLTAQRVDGTNAFNETDFVQIGPMQRCIRIVASDPSSQVPLETTVSIVASDRVRQLGATTLGFYPGMSSSSLPTTAAQVAKDLSFKTQALEFDTALTILEFERDAITDPLDPTHITVTGMSDPPTVQKWDAVDVETGLNAGRYYVDSISGFDIYLQTGLPFSFDPSNGTALPLIIDIGEESVVFSSKNNTSLTSALTVTGSARPLFFNNDVNVTGTTTWFKLPSTAGVDAGDLLQFFPDNYDTPSFSAEVISVDGALVQVNSPIAFSPASWTFDPSPPPFAKVRVGHDADFTAFSLAAYAWLALPLNTDAYFRDLNRKINPLLVSKNPTAAQFNEAMTALATQARYLSGISASTIEHALRLISVNPVPQVDALIKTYTQKGCDRAIDLLLSGSFDTFFDLTADTSSYGGAMQAAMTDVARSDLPVRKSSRANAVQATLLGSTPSPDYEFDTSDTEGNVKPDAPVDFEKGT